MIDTPNDDQPGFVAEEPKHCFACFRLICPGRTYYLTIDHEVLCADCALDDGMIRLRDDLACPMFAAAAGTESPPPGVPSGSPRSPPDQQSSAPA
jgi:hypothetical protein